MPKTNGHTCLSCKCLGCPCSRNAEEELGAIIKFKPEVTYNNNRTNRNGKKAPDGIELRFGSVRPTVEVRDLLKAHGFQFSEKQTIWYARDNAKARELIALLESKEIDADDTQYKKRYLWAKIKTLAFYEKLRNYTEFMIAGTPPRFFRTKKQLENSVNPKEYLFSDKLRFKKFYNKVVGEEEGEESDEESSEETFEESIEERDEEEEENDENQDNEGEESEQENEDEVADEIRDIPLADKLKDLALGMQKQIDGKLNSATSRQRPTAKRLRVASGMRSDGYYLKNIQSVLFGLSETYRRGNINNYPLLKNIRTKSQVELLNKYADWKGTKHEDHYLESVFKNNTATFKQLGITSVYNWSRAISQRGELLQHFPSAGIYQRSEQQNQLEEMEMKIKGMKIPGFFPTPKDLIEELLSLADIESGNSILEPSAGKGDILDAIKNEYAGEVTLSACEINPTLREFLTLKGYKVLGSNFLELNQKFDRIIMNPPFESGQDAAHVRHALSLLNRDGRVVAIMGEGVFFRKFNKEKEFREMLMEKNAYVSEPIKEAFKNAFNQTGITVRIVVINENGTLPEFDETEDESDDENDTLELEALAEIELLKLKLEKKRRGLNGIDQIENNNKQEQNVNGTTEFPDIWNFN